MRKFAPRIPDKLLAELERLDNPNLPIAEIHRRLGDRADRLGLTRPSYQRVRELVHLRRERGNRIGLGEVMVDVAFRLRPPGAILDHVSGVGVPDRT